MDCLILSWAGATPSHSVIFDANIFIRGVFGHDLINSQRSFYEVPGAMVSYNLLRSARDIKNPDTGTYLDVDNALGKFSSLHVEKADYVKIQNVSIGYNFNMANSNAFQKIRVYFAGNNLATFTSYKGAEPEVRYSDDDGGVLAPGIDRRGNLVPGKIIGIRCKSYFLIIH
jgi:hypothetical protein